MMTRKRLISAMALTPVVLLVGLAFYVGEPGPGNASTIAWSDTRQEGVKREAKVRIEKEKIEAFAMADNWESEFVSNPKTVKGAPFTAQVVIEDAQSLSNGVLISHKVTGGLSRDSEGRIRREMPSNGPTEIVLINDPVAEVIYKLNLIDRKGVKVTFGEQEGNRERERRELEERREMELKKKMEQESQGARSERSEKRAERDNRIESLGVQTIEGVRVEGRRTTITFAAGSEGNDKPFDVVSESWYSPELQTVVMSKHSDPRRGEVTYQLININRNEPPRSSFEPPQDFTVKTERVERRKMETDRK